MTHEEFCSYIETRPFIDQEEWANILQNEEHDIMVDYGDYDEVGNHGYTIYNC